MLLGLLSVHHKLHSPRHLCRKWIFTSACVALFLAGSKLLASENTPAIELSPTFVVTNYQVRGEFPLPAEQLASLFSRFTGTNVSLTNIVEAAKALQLEYWNRGYSTVSVAIAEHLIANGMVTMNVFHG